MMFSAFLSITLFKRVLLVFYKTGHSHMMADRVVAWCRNNTRGINLYDAESMMDNWNSVKSVEAEFFSHVQEDRPFYVQWESVLGKYFKKLPTGFTNNYCFEFFEGKCIMRELCSLDSAGLEHVFTPTPKVVAKAIINDLFNVDSVDQIALSRINLPQHQGNSIEAKKLKSLSLKYMSIPRQFQSFYPRVDPEEEQSAAGQEEPMEGVESEPAPEPVNETTVEFRSDPRGRKSNKKRCLQNLNQNSILKYCVPRQDKESSDQQDELVGKIVEVKFDDIWYEGKIMERLGDGRFRVFFEEDQTSMEIKYPFQEDDIRLKLV
jgi:hypothetical protein